MRKKEPNEFVTLSRVGTDSNKRGSPLSVGSVKPINEIYNDVGF